jgi:hypothetical protein
MAKIPFIEAVKVKGTKKPPGGCVGGWYRRGAALVFAFTRTPFVRRRPGTKSKNRRRHGFA